MLLALRDELLYLRATPNQRADIATRVARGAALLDTSNPDWRRQIAPWRLSIASAADCVLGQLYGSFGRGQDTFSKSQGRWIDSVQHGFAWRDAFLHGERLKYVECALLRREWTRAVRGETWRSRMLTRLATRLVAMQLFPHRLDPVGTN